MRACVHGCVRACMCRATEMIGGGGLGRANRKIGTPQNGLFQGGLGACPQEISRFYML